MYDMTVRQLVDMVEGGEIEIAPEYQRHFVWDTDRESELIESIYLGIPVPSLYMAANQDGTWEVVDGVQRLSTLAHFCGSAKLLAIIQRKESLNITNLKKLTKLNGKTFDSLPKAVQLNFQLRPVRVTTLNDKSDFSVRYDLFERLNTGGVKLHAQEIRNCVFRGEFRNLLKELSADRHFLKVVKLSENEQQSAIYEECVLRFFAFTDAYQSFDHSVVDFLNDYMINNNKHGPKLELIGSFKETMAWLAEELPGGIARGNRSITPLNLFEAIAVGTALALKKNKRLQKGRLKRIMDSDELRKLTTGATNSKKMVSGRILLVYNKLLA
jgi:uncharacterized protein with ParB-like and HNH nuclease domain